MDYTAHINWAHDKIEQSMRKHPPSDHSLRGVTDSMEEFICEVEVYLESCPELIDDGRVVIDTLRHENIPYRAEIQVYEDDYIIQLLRFNNGVAVYDIQIA